MASQKSAPIAYITQSFPGLTITFIYREIAALQRKGFDIATFAIWKPAKATLSQESQHWLDSTCYVFPIVWRRFLLAHLEFLVKRPIKYSSTALFVLTRTGESWKNRLRTVYHFAEAVYLAKEMERRGIRHVHAHFEINAASIALIVSRLLNISFSFTAHNTFFTDKLILRDKVRKARFIVAISEFTRQLLCHLFPSEDSGKIHIVHCGLSPDDFVPSDSKTTNPVPTLVFVAQLVERKGAPFLVEACKLLVERKLVFRCIIIGDGPEKSLVEQLVAQYALHDTIQLTGAVFQEHLKEYLNRADVFVLPCITARNGDMDGVPVSLMEAMAMEIPVVSTCVSGIPELIQDGHSGLLVREKDAVSLANALQRLLEDSALRKTLGKHGREKIMQDFDIHKNADQLADLFERYLNR